MSSLIAIISTFSRASGGAHAAAAAAAARAAGYDVFETSLMIDDLSD